MSFNLLLSLLREFIVEKLINPIDNLLLSLLREFIVEKLINPIDKNKSVNG